MCLGFGFLLDRLRKGSDLLKHTPWYYDTFLVAGSGMVSTLKSFVLLFFSLLFSVIFCYWWLHTNGIQMYSDEKSIRDNKIRIRIVSKSKKFKLKSFGMIEIKTKIIYQLNIMNLNDKDNTMVRILTWMNRVMNKHYDQTELNIYLKV